MRTDSLAVCWADASSRLEKTTHNTAAVLRNPGRTLIGVSSLNSKTANTQVVSTIANGPRVLIAINLCSWGQCHCDADYKPHFSGGDRLIPRKAIHSAPANGGTGIASGTS